MSLCAVAHRDLRGAVPSRLNRIWRIRALFIRRKARIGSVSSGSSTRTGDLGRGGQVDVGQGAFEFAAVAGAEFAADAGDVVLHGLG